MQDPVVHGRVHERGDMSSTHAAGLCAFVLSMWLGGESVCVAQDPSWARMLITEGERQQTAGNYAAAEASYRSAYEAHPEPNTLRLLAQVQEQQGNTAGAIESLERFLATTSPDNPHRFRVELHLQDLRPREPPSLALPETPVEGRARSEPDQPAPEPQQPHTEPRYVRMVGPGTRTTPPARTPNSSSASRERTPASHDSEASGPSGVGAFFLSLLLSGVGNFYADGGPGNIAFLLPGLVLDGAAIASALVGEETGALLWLSMTGMLRIVSAVVAAVQADNAGAASRSAAFDPFVRF